MSPKNQTDPDRRNFLVGTCTLLSGVGLFGLTSTVYAQGYAQTIGNESLPGNVFDVDMFKMKIDQSNERISFLNLANEQALNVECSKLVEAAKAGQKQISSAKTALVEKKDDAFLAGGSAAISAISTGLSVAAVFTTTPLWITATGLLLIPVATGFMAVSLAKVSEKKDMSGGLITLTSHVAGRTSLIFNNAARSSAAMSAIALVADSISLFNATGDYLEAANRLNEAESSHQKNMDLVDALQNDPALCRKNLIESEQGIVDGMNYLISLGDIEWVSSGQVIP